MARPVSPEKWAYMQSVGRQRWILRSALLRWLVFSVLWNAGAAIAVIAAGGASVLHGSYGVSALLLPSPVLLLAPLAWLSARYHWSECEQSMEIRRPTASILGPRAAAP